MDGYSSGFSSADNELSTRRMVPEVHFIKNQISKLNEAIKLLIGIRGVCVCMCVCVCEGGGDFAITLHQTMAAL